MPIYLKILYTIMFVATGIVIYLLGVMHGAYLERKAWNGLIDDGILPKPKKSLDKNSGFWHNKSIK